MPASILISTRKNGRPLKTYGVKRYRHNMKFTFICIVIVISCGVCASDDLEIYNPRSNFNRENRRYRLKRYERPSYYSKFEWQIPPLDEYREFKSSLIPEEERVAAKMNQLKGLAEKIRQYEEVIDFEKTQLNVPSRPRHERLKPLFHINLPEVSKDFLENEARIFSPDDDFDLNNEDNEQNIFGRPKFDEESNTKALPNSEPENPHSMHAVREDDKGYSNEFASGRFKDIQILGDPADFAYAPPDSRYYRKSDESQHQQEVKSNSIPSVTGNLYNPPTNQLKVTLRNEINRHGGEEGNTGYETETDQDKSTLVMAHKIGDGEVVAIKPSVADVDSTGVYIIAIVAGISAAATVGLIAVGIGWYNLQKHVKNASDVEYPAYGVTGPNKDISPSGDRRLAQSAQMYHYQHQKQQIIAMERAQPGERHGSVSEADSDEENEEGDYTVYECPGLAPTGEMEVKNPLFQDDPTPAQTPALKTNNTEDKK